MLMRPLKRLPLPLLCRWRARVRRGAMLYAAQARVNAYWPEGVFESLIC